MKCLFLVIASHEGFLACSTEQSVIHLTECDHRISDAELVPLGEEALKKAKWTYQDLTHLACIVGPGGFTSLRIAVAYMNTLAHQLNLPSASVHMSDFYCARSTEKDVLWIHSTKKHELFVRGFGKHEKLWPKPLHVQLDDFVTTLPQGAHWMGELIEEHQIVAQEASLQEANLKSVQEAIPTLLSAVKYDDALLLPWYGRGY